MATDTGKSYRGVAGGRTQVRESAGHWQRRDAHTGEFFDWKSSGRDAGSKDRVQVQNPVTRRWIKIDTSTGRIVDEKLSDGPFKGIAIGGEPKPKK